MKIAQKLYFDVFYRLKMSDLNVKIVRFSIVLHFFYCSKILPFYPGDYCFFQNLQENLVIDDIQLTQPFKRFFLLKRVQRDKSRVFQLKRGPFGPILGRGAPGDYHV